jgi:hypothetical protein
MTFLAYRGVDNLYEGYPHSGTYLLGTWFGSNCYAEYMRKVHTNQCRWEATKGGFIMFFASIVMGLLAQEIPHHVHVEPVKIKHSSDTSSSLHVYYPGKDELY